MAKVADLRWSSGGQGRRPEVAKGNGKHQRTILDAIRRRDLDRDALQGALQADGGAFCARVGLRRDPTPQKISTAFSNFYTCRVYSTRKTPKIRSKNTVFGPENTIFRPKNRQKTYT